MKTSKEKVFGGHVSTSEFCYTPGTTVETDITFMIVPKGIWKSKSDQGSISQDQSIRGGE